jgi:hypothetical protein
MQKLPTEIIQIILKIKWWNARKERLEKKLLWPKLVKGKRGRQIFYSCYCYNQKVFLFQLVYVFENTEFIKMFIEFKNNGEMIKRVFHTSTDNIRYI